MVKRKQNKKGMRTRCTDCGGRIPQGESNLSWYCQTIGLCRYCYRAKFPRRKRKRTVPPLRQGSERLLSWSERREMERRGFNETLWSPEFRAEMHDYWEARMRGEI